MAYDKKVDKKCTFVNLKKDPLTPPFKKKKIRNEKAIQRSRELTDWRNGWFKGGYKKTTKSHESS